MDVLRSQPGQEDTLKMRLALSACVMVLSTRQQKQGFGTAQNVHRKWEQCLFCENEVQ
jgi:hypothetical protein